MRLQTKFIFTGLLSAIVVAAMVGVTFWTAQLKERQADTFIRISNITQHHMEGDMMHDAMRGDALSAMLAIQSGNGTALTTAREDMDTHYAKFKENLEANKNEPLPEDIKALFEKAGSLLEAYHEAGLDITYADVASMDYLFKDFSKRFSELEDDLEMISDEIGLWAKREGEESQRVSLLSKQISGALSIIALLLSLFVPFYAYLSIFSPQQRLIDAMQRLTEGDTNIEITGLGRKDEIGAISAALQVFKDAAIKKAQMEAEQQQVQQRAQEEKKKMMHQLAQRFEEKVQNMINGVAKASMELNLTAESMKQHVDNVNVKARSAALSSSQTSQNVHTVASASEEMAASVREISSQVGKSTQVVNEAVKRADAAGGSAASLEAAATKIGDVVGLIRDIAEQINLLALNATIESARAGEAGRGFAVVASEVKNLASQTTQATEDIAQQIDAVQGVSKQVVEALTTIKTTIDNVNQFSGGIASAVEEQTATTNEIAQNMQVAARGSEEINTSLTDITNVISTASASSQQMLGASQILLKESDRLSSEVGQFLAEIREGA